MCRNEILVFLMSAHFPCRVKMRSFQKIFSKNLYFLGYCASNLGTVQGFKLNSEHPFRVFQNVSDEHTYINSTLKVPPPLGFWRGFWLSPQDNNYLEKLNAY